MILKAIFFVSFVISTFFGQPAVAELVNIPPVSKEDMLKFSLNGTSFDEFIKHRLQQLNDTGQVHLSDPKFQQNTTKFTTLCMSTTGRAFLTSLNCDYLLSIMFEMCQISTLVNPYVCTPSSLKEYLAKERNITDGQTDKLAWLYMADNYNGTSSNNDQKEVARIQLNAQINSDVDICLRSLPNGRADCDTQLIKIINQLCNGNNHHDLDACHNGKIAQYYKMRKLEGRHRPY